MKILLISPIPHDILFDLKNCLKDLNHDVYFIGTQDFEEQYTYVEKKIYKLGFVSLKENYYKKFNEKIKNIYLEFNPDLVFITNGGELDHQLLDFIKNKTKIIAWFFDSAKREFIAKSDKNFSYYDKIFVFEKNDIPYLKEKYGLEAQFCPIGYNNKKYYPIKKSNIIDITFVGNPSEKRISILREVAEYVDHHHLNMKIYGLWYNDKHFWKRYQFKKREPILFKYITNRIIPPETVADLYRQSKICLNIHIALHAGINPRTFEILGTKSFELIDKRNDYDNLIRPNIDVGVYENADDLINKIDYYLENEKEREQISNSGYEWIKDRLAMSNCMETILKMIS